MSEIPVDTLVKTYRRIRSAVEQKEEEHKTIIEDLKAQLNVISEQLLEICNSQNVDSLRTKEGTVSRTVKTRYWTTDWEKMYDFIMEENIPQLLEQRIHNNNMKQFLEEHPDKMPIGLQADRKYIITVRKPRGA